MTEITYIWHDCFMVRRPECALVFDYWHDAGSDESKNQDSGVGVRSPFPRFLDMIDAGKPLYVFVSHSHKDHYNPDVFAWAARFPRIHYVLSRDVWHRCRHIASETSVYAGPKVDRAMITVLEPGAVHEDGLVRVAAFPSTDIGNSYMVEVKRERECPVRFFHAGDLNAWIWKDESTEQEVRKAMGDFEACLVPVEAWLDASAADGDGECIDYAFFPVDSRIGTDYFTGAATLLGKVCVRRFFPMHFGLGNEEEQKRYQRDAMRFDLFANRERGEYIPLCEPYTTYVNAEGKG